MVMLDTKQLNIIKEKLYEYCGIYLGDSKLTMIKNRIYHLMRETQVSDINTLLAGLIVMRKSSSLLLIALQQTRLIFFVRIFIFKI